MKLTSFHIMWDIPEDLPERDHPPLTLPLALKRADYETHDAYEEDVFKRLEESGGYPVVAFVEAKTWTEIQDEIGNPHGVADQEVKKQKKLSRKQKKKMQKASKKKNRK